MIGLDLGTQGVRAVAATRRGKVLAGASRRYETINAAPDPYREQDARQWRAAAFAVLSEVAGLLHTQGAAGPAILSVDGTSGTILPIDPNGQPLQNAIMYHDSRAAGVIGELHEKTAALEEKLGYRMSASFALPKIFWLKRNRPARYEKTAVFLHQADYLVGCLTGNFHVTDYSNALKTGYDLLEERWPVEVLAALGIDPALLPRVVKPGQLVGRITVAAAAETGLPADTLIVAGATDGYASCVASGVVCPGQYHTTIGTTLVLKGVTAKFVKDPAGRVYCHKHPEGYWYPGGAGNAGGLCLNQWFGADRFEVLNAKVPSFVPTGNLIYPLTAPGERFPFVKQDAEAFFLLKNEDEAARYAGTMEGVGYVERLCYDTLSSLGCEIGEELAITGGAVKAPVWSQIRANILGKRLLQPEIAEAAFGSAMIAGTVALDRTLSRSAQSMARYVRAFEPDEKLHAIYNELYAEFCQECVKRNFIHEHL